MLLLLNKAFLFWLALSYILSLPTYAQEPAPAPAPASSPKPANLDYADNPHGLEHLAKDIIKAQKEGHESRALELAQSMVLPDPAAWYLRTFGPDIANDEGAKYAAGKKTLPAEILKIFFGAIQNDFTDVTAARFGESCDDNAGESAFGTLQLRLEPVPLYELRLRNGDRFLRLSTIVYVDGGFRYAIAPRVPDHFPYVPARDRNLTREVTAGVPNGETKPLRVGNIVQAARIVRKVQPDYPETARNEHLQGTVRLHAIIGKDGAISRLLVLHGYCSLAKSSMKAVIQWRYTPVLLNGEPVEVDTTIDVIFALNR
ncbi:MAG TPA: energy transducer TonB [Candidatus Angelobacter sp.]|nr:energy transducer TonB [Candidatus Angelobacter sp.]